jgi:hypothetical protein
VAIAVRGRFESETGIFTVSDYLFAGPIPLSEPMSDDLPSSSTQDEDSYLLFVSGLELGDRPDQVITPSLISASMTAMDEGNENDDYLLACQLLVDYVSGRLEDLGQAQRIARVIVAGNSIAASDPLLHRDRYSNHSSQKQLEAVKSMRQVASFLIDMSLALTINVPSSVAGSLSGPALDFLSGRSDAWTLRSFDTNDSATG